MQFTRRRFVQAIALASLGASLPAGAQAGPIRLGLMTVKTGPLASGGIDMERALARYLKERKSKMSGRKVELTVRDYGTYLAQLKTNIDGVFLGFAGSNGFRYLRQFNEYALRGKVVPVGGMSALDEAVLRNMGDEALGIVTSCWYSAEIENAINKRFVANFRVDHGYDPGFYAAATYT